MLCQSKHTILTYTQHTGLSLNVIRHHEVLKMYPKSKLQEYTLEGLENEIC